MNFKRRLGILGVGLSANWIMVWTFDFIIYPFVIYFFGLFWGGLIMIVLSFVVCYLTLLFYDWAKKDWIGIETIKNLKHFETKTLLGKWVQNLLKKSDLLVFLIISIKFDPFITVIYMRHGANLFNGLSTRDWKIFLSSLFVGNIYWIFVAYTGITLIEFILKLLKNI